LVYPQIFKVDFERMEFEDTLVEQGGKYETLDGDMAIDRLVKVWAKAEGFHQPISFTVQERFRRAEYSRWKDLTITEWNNNSSLPSELYKLMANLFVYGYYDDEAEFFLDVISVNVPAMLMAICDGSMKFTRGFNGRSKQDFIALGFWDLWKSKASFYWQARDDGRDVPY